MNRRTLLLGGATAAIVLVGGGLLLRPQPGLAAAQTYVKDGLAIGGTDPVAYFTDGKPVAGDPSITHDWNGATWAFASTEHRDTFAADPEAYAPQYGGFCAWAVAAKRELFTTQAENWSIEGGKLYLNYDDKVQQTWNEDRPGFIREADEAWPEVSKE